MKLHFPVDALWDLAKKMGAAKRDYELNSISQKPLPPIVTAAGGIDVTIDEIDTAGGLLSSNGAQVVLYIPDQGHRIDQVLAQPNQGRKVHVADCITLEEMRQKNRYQRYRAVVNVTGDFDVFGVSKLNNKEVAGKARLQVCINCLKYLNYRGYLTDPSRQYEIRNNFNLKDFFAENSTFFKYLPTSFVERKSGYSDDWKQVSDQYRQQQNFVCEACQVDLKSYKHLLHTHHKDGNKQNNHLANLAALCADCHRKQPLHDHIFIKAADMSLLQRLRKEQQLLRQECDWQVLFDLIDPPYAGLLRFYERDNVLKPEVGYEITNAEGAVVAEVELAWPDARFAITENDSEKAALVQLGWQALTLEEALKGYRDKK